MSDAPATGDVTHRSLPADDRRRNEREPLAEMAFRCQACDRPWVIWAVEGEPSDGVDPRRCRFCETDLPARRIR